MNSLQPLRADVDQQKQLDSFFKWLIGIAATSFVGCGILWLMQHQEILTLMEVINVAALLGLALARFLLSRGNIRASVVTTGAIMIFASCGLTATAPETLQMMVLVPPLMVATFLPYIDNRTMLHTCVAALIFELTLMVLAIMAPLRLAVPPEVELVIVPLVTALFCGVLLIMLWQFHGRITSLLDVADQTNLALQQAHAGLESQVSARTADLRTALEEIETRSAQQGRLLAEVEQQREVIRELSVPLLPVARNTLVLPLVGALDSARISILHEQALTAVERTRARHLLIDVTGVAVIDTQVAHGIIKAIQSARLLGAQSALVGIRPEVAQTIVNLGVDLSEVRTYPDLETALSR